MQVASTEKPNVEKNKKRLLRFAALLFFCATGIVFFSMGDIQAWLRNIDVARAWILQHGVFETAVVFFFANTMLCACGFPRLWTSVFAGMVFGGPLGFALSLPSSLAGALVTFLFARRIGSQRLLSTVVSKWSRAVVLIRSPDVVQTLLIRQLPMPGIVTTLLFAASNITVPVFIVGSVIGFTPGAAIACFLGDTATIAQTQRSIATASAVILLAIAATAFLHKAFSATHGKSDGDV